MSNFSWSDGIVAVLEDSNTAGIAEVQEPRTFPVGFPYHFGSYPYLNAHAAILLAVPPSRNRHPLT